MRATLFPETISPMTSGKKKSPETLRSYRWLGPDNLRAFGHRSRLRQLGYDRADWAGKPVIGILNTWRWGNRPAFLWIAEDFGCCASG
jgi:hypothetical protein